MTIEEASQLVIQASKTHIRRGSICFRHGQTSKNFGISKANGQFKWP